jgi:uncharacterized protein YndB with AHSA1/START domain
VGKEVLLAIMSQPSAVNDKIKATTTKRWFSRETRVATEIKADRNTIWSLITNAADYPKWNSTVISIAGEIAMGKTIVLKSTLAPTREFKLRVKEFDPPSRMIWGDAMGNRVYELTDKGNGIVLFTMTEKIGGPVFPLFAKLIPSFDAAFETFAKELKAAAEAG